MKKIQTRLSFIFLISGLLSTASFLLVFKSINTNQNNFENLNNRNSLLQYYFLKDIKVTRDFFSNEIINSKYFKTEKSPYLEEHRHLMGMAKNLTLRSALEKDKFGHHLSNKYRKLLGEFGIYSRLIDSMVSYVNMRGFKDYGLEGRMREFAHGLEDLNSTGISILLLRRHEKDFIIRQDTVYQAKFHKEAEQMKKLILRNPAIAPEKRQMLAGSLDNYEIRFDSLVRTDMLTGLKSQTGLKKKIDLQVDQINGMLEEISAMAYAKSSSYLNSVITKTIISWIILNIVLICISFYFANNISKAIISLKEKVSRFIESDFTNPCVEIPLKAEDEVEVLTVQFALLERHIERQMKVLKAQNKELKLLIYRASHDLRSPFTAIKGAVNYAMSNVEDKETLDILSKINTVTNNFNDIVEELAMVSDIKNGELALGEVNMEGIIKNCLSSFEFHSNVRLDLDVRIQHKFVSDTRFIRMLLRNLVENSIKYADRKKPFTEVKISVFERSDEMIELVVSDNGIGIKKEFHERIFDMFFRATDVERGTGLGLYIVQNVLQKLSGAVKLESREGQGTTFTIYIPNSAAPKTSVFRHENKSKELVLDFFE